MSNGETGTPISRRGFLRAAAGTAAVGASGTAAAQETTQGGESGGTTQAGGGGGTTQSGGGGGGGGGGTETVEVGPGGNYTFVPGTDEPLVIAPGTTVEFVWKSDNHNVVVSSQPEGASWSGHEPIENSGFSFSHTFETLGTYEYFCQPHQALGMTGTIEVKEGGGQAATPAGPVEPPIPNSAKTLGIATIGGMTATLGFAYFFLKYGGDYDTPE